MTNCPVPSSFAAITDHEWKEPVVQVHLGIAFFVVIAASIGLVWSLVSLFRGKSQWLGPLALFLFSLAFLGGALVVILHPSELIRDFLPFFSAILFSFGTLAAIVSLAIYRGRIDVYPGGPHAGVWSLILNVVALLGVFYYANAEKELAETAEEKSKNREVQEVWLPPVAGEKVLFDEVNFSFAIPDRPWISLNPKHVNPDASIVLRKYREETIFIVIAERIGVDYGMTNEALQHIAMANMEAAYLESEVRKDKPVKIDGIEFVNCRCEGSDRGSTFYHRNYVAVHNGFAYQLIGITEDSWQATEQLMADMTRRFKLIDPNAVCYSSGDAISEPVVMPELGLTANLQGTGWLSWDLIEEEFDVADFGAQFGSAASFGLVSIDLQGHEVSLDELAAAMLWVAWGETQYPEEIEQSSPFESNGVSGLELRMRHNADGEEFLDLIRIFEHEGRGWCLILWAGEDGADRFDDLATVLDKIIPGSASDSDGGFGLSKRQTEVRGQIFNRLGLMRYEAGDFEDAAAFFETALNYSPENQTYSLNIAYSLEEVQDYEAAISVLEKYKTQNGVTAEVAAEIAWNLYQSGNEEAAIENYEEAFRLGHGDADRFFEYLVLLSDADRDEEALEAIDLFEKKHASDSTVIWRADILDGIGRTAEAIDVLEKRLNSGPFDGSIAYDLAEYHLEVDQPQKCLEVCRQIIEDDEETWDVAWLRGQAHMTMENFRKAKSAFETAVKLNPDNEYLSHSLARASAALGEGDNSLVKDMIEPVPITDELQQLLEENAAEIEDESFGAQVLRRVRMIHFEKGSPQRESLHLTVRITGERGVSAYKMLRYHFDPFAERLYINKMEVRDDSGKLLAKGDVNDFYVMDEAGQSMATDNQTLNAPVPGLARGVTLDLTVSRETLADQNSFQFVDHVFYDNYPSRYEAIAITGEIESIEWETEGQLDVFEGDQLIAWSLQKPARLTSESLQPPLDQYLPSLWIAASGNDWESISAEYIEELESLLKETPSEVSTAAERVTANSADLNETVTLLAQFVRNELTYNAIEFGPRGRIPPPAGRTLRNRYGDCKDHSLLLYHLLKAHGIESHLTLANTTREVRRELPNLNQFNHMILWVPDFAGGQFIDCTDDYLAVSELPPQGLGGSFVLILDPENPRIERIDAYPDNSNHFRVTRKISIKDDDLLIEEEAVFSGYRAARLRDYFAISDPEEYQSRLQQTFQILPGLRLSSVEFADFDDMQKPLRVLLRYTIADGAEISEDGAIECKLPAPWELFYLKADYIENRRTPFELAEPHVYESRFEFAEGQNWRFADPESLDLSGSSEFGQWSARLENDAIFWNYSQHAGVFEAGEYEAFIDARDAALKLFERETRIEPR